MCVIHEVEVDTIKKDNLYSVVCTCTVCFVHPFEVL